MRAVFKKSSQFILILAISFGWIFSGWPQIYNFPPSANIAYADQTTKTYSFPSDTESWSATACGAAGATCIWQSGAGSPANGSLEEPETRKNKGGTWTWQLSGITWENIGVPSGATVTAVDGSYNHTMATCTDCNTTGSNTSGTLSIRDSGDTATVATLETAVSYTGAAGWASRNASGAQSIGASYQASNTAVIIRLSGSIQTNNVTGAQAVIRQDEISLTITYTPASNNPPDKPTNSSPADTATDVGVNPTLTGSAFSDSDGGDTHQNTEWQVDDDVDFATPVWTRTAGSGEESTVINTSNGTFANELSGETQLANSTQYYWQVRYSDGTDWSSWSDATSFTTVAIFSITITSSGVIEYGFVEIGTASSTVGNGYTQTAQNDGNTAEKLNVKSSDATVGTGWTLASTIGTNQFKHEFSTTTGSRWDVMPNSATYVTADPSVAVSGTATFDFRLTVPSASTAYQQKSITITVQAVAP